VGGNTDEFTMVDDRESVTVWFGLGGNLGDRIANLARALTLLAQTCDGLEASAVFETPPWGDLDQPSFLNLVARGTTRRLPEALLARVKEIEYTVGRRPTRRWGPRVVDVDILAYGTLVTSTAVLEIPHPRMAERAFVMMPLAYLDPAWIHPSLGVTAAALVDALSLTDRRGIMKIGPAPRFDTRSKFA
jgi:2-amino-4-hydroxy-6-hydroxymethyldihydropteridine diphosphokinase